MKLQLTQAGEIQVLTVSGTISPQHFKVLRSGIRDLLKKGKNNIVLELTDVKGVPTPLLRELASLNLIARELAGNIVLSNIDPESAKRVENLSVPPMVECYPNREAAIQSFRAPKKRPLPPPSAAAAAAAPSPTPVAAEEPSLSPAVEPTSQELIDLQLEIQTLRSQNKTLTERLASSLRAPRAAWDATVYEEKIRVLEASLNDCLEKLKTLQK